MLNLFVAAHYARQKVDQICIGYGITHVQYNVLRILRGAYPNGYPRYEIRERMLEPACDVTRVVDRLIKAGFVKRFPSEVDRRLSVAKITPTGLKLLEKMQPDIEGADRQEIMGTLTTRECQELSRLCEKIYGHEIK